MPAAHGLHVLEVMNAADESIRTGASVAMTTTFALPQV